jgi:hypothetical protein
MKAKITAHGAGAPKRASVQGSSAELWQLSALELLEMIRRRTVSSREVVDGYLDRAEKINGRLNALVPILTTWDAHKSPSPI